MTATLDDVTAKKKRPEPTAEEAAAAELVRRAREQGLSLTGPDGLLKQLTKTVLETALNEEITEHLGHEKRAPAGIETGNVRNGTRAKTVLAAGSLRSSRYPAAVATSIPARHSVDLPAPASPWTASAAGEARTPRVKSRTCRHSAERTRSLPTAATPTSHHSRASARCAASQGPVTLAGSRATSRGVPWATIWPPSGPPPGPMSMR